MLNQNRQYLRPIDNSWQNGSSWVNEKSPRQQGFSFSEPTSMLSAVKSFIASQWPSSSAGPLRSSPLSAKPPLTPLSAASSGTLRFIFMCSLWYTTSALSSNTGKSIMNQFRYPITLTIIQFGFVASYCLLFMTPAIRFTRLRRPTKQIIWNTLPMGMFQVGGHVFSSIAISRVPVSTVHTIKALSPLFTVAAYALLFGVSYSAKTYVSLLPLTLGVMLACSFDMSASNAVGLLCAFGSALVFVSSNIFFKKVMPSSGQPSSHKLDKLNLLLYSSGMAFLLMIPIWAYYDLPIFLSATVDHVAHPGHGHEAPHSVTYYFFMNGTVHFAQNIIAFIILSSTSPVTYSIASLIKRVAVICIAIVWFNQTIHPVQGFGILMTFVGLYMYNNAKGDVEKGENKMRRVEAARDMILPSTKEESRMLGVQTPPEYDHTRATPNPYGRTRVTLTPQQRPPFRQYMPNVNSHSIQLHPPSTAAPPPSLTIKVPPHGQNIVSRQNPSASPVDSYPSPPPSIDSPPLKTVLLEPHVRVEEYS